MGDSSLDDVSAESYQDVEDQDGQDGDGQEHGIPDAVEQGVPADAWDAPAERSTAEILAELRELRELFDSKIRYDEAKERQIEALHQELQGYRQGLYQQIMTPVMVDLIAIYDEMASQQVQPSIGGPTGLDFLMEMAEEVLARYGVVRFECDGESIDRSRQRVIDTEATTTPGLGKRLARRLRPGFEMKGKVIRPEWVVAYRYVPGSGQAADE
jgi:molecular chaperone GrpE (heat shock protein)